MIEFDYRDTLKFSNAKSFRKKTTIKAIQIDEEFTVKTLEGIMKGKRNDWLAMGVSGELYCIDDEIFHLTYELVK